MSGDKAPQLDSPGDESTQNHVKVPRFFAGAPSLVEADKVDIVTSIVTILFGAVHCFAWSFHFPSETERLLWRIASLVTTASPIVWTIVYTFALMDDPEDSGPKHISTNTLYSLSAIVVPVYLIARIILLVIALLSLRSLSPAAYETVYWTVSSLMSN